MTGTDLKQRLVAILAADAVGYSRLMSQDERGTVAALDAARAVFRSHVESNQGRVIDMAGDSVLAVFETAAGALNAAIQIQAQLTDASKNTPVERRMQFRIGIHSGDVMEKADGSVYGDGVNIAARLQALAEPSQITVSDAIHGAVRGKVSANFTDQGEQTVKNISHPIRAYRVPVGEQTDPQLAPVAQPLVGEIDLSLPHKPSIAVLPFANMSGDQEQEYFTDGITEDIITELSRFRSLFVIARNSSFTYKGKAVDVRTVSKGLGVRYVLEGSIRRAANRIRVTAQLIDALTGNHIWAEKYDRVLEDIFEVQEEVTRSIVSAIGPQIDASEHLRTTTRRPGNFTAYELAVQARALAVEGFHGSDRAQQDEAIRLARAALEIDPKSAIALRALAHVRMGSLILSNASDPEEAWREGMSSATKAIELDESSEGHATRSWLLAFAPAGRRWEEARIEAETAYRLNPNDPNSAHSLGFMLMNAGEESEAVKLLEQSLRLSPRDPLVAKRFNSLALAHWFLKDYSKALEWAMRSVAAKPNIAGVHGYLTVIFVGLGEYQKAKRSLETMRRLAPEMAERWLRGDTTIAQPVHRERCATFFRIAAGLEDPSAANQYR